jgi:hypothetical protein
MRGYGDSDKPAGNDGYDGSALAEEFRSFVRQTGFGAGRTLALVAHDMSNAPHQFYNASSMPARLLCICSPAGQEKFFVEVGVPVATRTAPPPKLDAKQQAEFKRKVAALAPKYRTELLEEA